MYSGAVYLCLLIVLFILLFFICGCCLLVVLLGLLIGIDAGVFLRLHVIVC